MEEVSVYKQIAERVMETLIKEIATVVEARMPLASKGSPDIDRWWNEFKDSGYFHEAVRLSIWGEESETVKRVVRSCISDWWLEFRTTVEFKEWVQAVQLPNASDEYIKAAVREELSSQARKLVHAITMDALEQGFNSVLDHIKEKS